MINRFWWLWLPLLLLVFQVGFELSFPHDVLAVMHGERGPLEQL